MGWGRSHTPELRARARSDMHVHKKARNLRSEETLGFCGANGRPRELWAVCAPHTKKEWRRTKTVANRGTKHLQLRSGVLGGDSRQRAKAHSRIMCM